LIGKGTSLYRNPEEMKTVRSIVRLREEGLSMQSIADEMNDTGTHIKLGGYWHAVTIQKFLRFIQ